MTAVNVTATPTSDPTDLTTPPTYVIDCNHCGAVGVATADDMNQACIDHLGYHGVDTTPFTNPPEVP